MSTSAIPHWAHLYLGKPWVSGARGPDAFDCWGLLWWVKKHHYNIEVPEYPGVDARDLTKVTSLLDEGTRSTEWSQLLFPLDGCAVGLSQARRFHHVGIYADVDGGLVVHAQDKWNVVAHSIPVLRRLGYKRIEFFDFNKPNGSRN